MRHSRAFSLLLVLVLLSGLAAFVTLLVALSPVAVAEQTVAAERMRLRQEASALLRLSLAEVQAAAGADQFNSGHKQRVVGQRAEELGRHDGEETALHEILW